MGSKRILRVDDVEFNIEFEDKVIKSFMKEVGIDIQIDVAYTVTEALKQAALKKSEETRIAALTIYPSKYEDQRAFFDIFLRKPIMPESYKENFAHLLRI